MTFSLEWEDAYTGRKIDGAGCSHLHILINNFCPNHQARVLEMGCGLGGNVPYWLNRFSDYYGIEGSQKAVDGVLQTYPYLSHNIVCDDFTTPMNLKDFDVVFDRASILHNDRAGIIGALSNVWKALKPGGIFVGCDWFSTKHSEMQRGVWVRDQDRAEGDAWNTRAGYLDGQFAGIGRVHFTDREEIDELFSEFQGVFLQERLTTRPAPNGRFITDVNPFRWVSRSFDDKDYVSAVWDIVARKPAHV